MRILYSLVLGNFLIHIYALFFLKQHKDNLRKKNQRNIIAALCGCELSGALLYGVFYICKLYVSEIILEVIFCFKIIYLSPIYYFIMYLLTIDRFLVFYLNIRYNVCVTSTKLIKLIIIIVTIPCNYNYFFSIDCDTEFYLAVAQPWNYFFTFYSSYCICFCCGSNLYLHIHGI